MSGPRAAAEDMGVEFGYRGQQLGLPESGPGSVAPVGRRVAALFVDWALCALVAVGLIARNDLQVANVWATVVFVVMSTAFVGVIGFTPGKRMLGLRLVRVDGSRLGPLHAALRSLLLVLVIPAVVWDRDSRGLHDKAAGVVQVRF